MILQEFWGEFERTGSIRAYLNYVSGAKEQLIHNGLDPEWGDAEELSCTQQNVEQEQRQLDADLQMSTGNGVI